VDISTASRQVGALVEVGFVRRTADPTDRRAALHELADEGRELWTRLVDARRRWVADIVVDLTEDERRTLGDLLGRVADRIEAIDRATYGT
jgi:DNA-binding MarR family transcriptional regulator